MDLPRIQATLAGSRGDATAFLVTLIGTWSLSLDKAIYLGVAVSIVVFLRRVRLLTVRELVVGSDGKLQEFDLDSAANRCPTVRIMHLEGSLFFGAAGELMNALDEATTDRAIRVLIVRAKRTQGMDITTASVIAQVARRLRDEGRTLLVVGLRADSMALLVRSGLIEELGADNVYPTRTVWFAAMNAALTRASELVDGHRDHAPCPLRDAQVRPKL